MRLATGTTLLNIYIYKIEVRFTKSMISEI